MHLAIRADGGADLGYGHLVRSGATASMMLDEGHGVTYCTRTPDAVASICPEDVSIHPLDGCDGAPDRWLNEVTPDFVLTDMYAADTEYQEAVTELVPHAVVDDDARYAVCADVLINGNVYAPDLHYDWVGSEPTWCLGTDYLPIRDAVRAQRARVPPVPESPERALVTMGGSDINNATPAVVRAFDATNLEVTVIIGPGFSNRDDIESAVRAADSTFQLKNDPPDLPALMASTDIAVSAAGSTVYELLALGTPTIAIPQAANQEPVASALEERGVIDRLSLSQIEQLDGWIVGLASDRSRRVRYHDRGMDLVDCNGTRRIYRILTKIARD